MDHLNQAIVCNDTQEKSLIHNVNKFISVSDLEIQKNIQTSIDILFQALEKYR